MKTRLPSLSLFVVGVIILTAILLYLDYRSTHHTQTNDLMFPKLEAQMDEINHIRLQHQGHVFNLRYRDNHWQIDEKLHQRADNAKIRALVLAIAKAKKLEPKTSDETRYQYLGLDPANVIDISLYADSDSNKTPLLQLHAGYLMEPLGGTYVRLHDDPQSWLVSGLIAPPLTNEDWLDSALFTIDKDQIKSIRIQPSNKKAYVFSRAKPEDRLMLENIPAGKQVRSSYEIEYYASLFETFQITDIIPKTKILFLPSTLAQVTIQTFAGDTYTVKITHSNDKKWSTATLSSSDKSSKAKQTFFASDNYAYAVPDNVYALVNRSMDELLTAKE